MDNIAKAIARMSEQAARSPESKSTSKSISRSEISSIEKAIMSVKLKGLSDATVEAYRTDVRSFLEFARSKALAPGDVSTLETYKRRLVKLGQRPSTINRKLIGVKRTLLEYARKAYDGKHAEVLRGVYKDVKLVKLNATEKHISREKLITEAEARRLQDGMPTRIGLIAEFLFQTGARISEALGAKPSSIREINGHSEILVIGKGLKARTLLVRSELLTRIRETFGGRDLLFETRNGTPYSRHYICREFVRASERELGKRVSPHCARHSFATWTLARTKKIKGVSEYLGHSDVSTTLSLYVHEKLDADELLGSTEDGS